MADAVRGRGTSAAPAGALSVAEAARRAGVSCAALYKAIDAGGLVALATPVGYVVRPQDLAEWMAGRRRGRLGRAALAASPQRWAGPGPGVSGEDGLRKKGIKNGGREAKMSERLDGGPKAGGSAGCAARGDAVVRLPAWFMLLPWLSAREKILYNILCSYDSPYDGPRAPLPDRACLAASLGTTEAGLQESLGVLAGLGLVAALPGDGPPAYRALAAEGLIGRAGVPTEGLPLDIAPASPFAD